MNIKIQGGGGGAYANTGSCAAVTTYLQHEELKQIQAGQEPEPFFNQDRDKVSAQEVTYKIDHNRAQLGKDDAKFFVLTVSPSEKELAAMGKTPQEQAAAMKDFIRNDVMQQYAEGFGKGLNANNIEYYAKVHFERKEGKEGNDMHAHIIVSRKDRSNTKKLSPQTNHRGKGKGAVKSGFNRTEFYKGVELGFDRRIGYDRDVKDSFEYQNAIRNGSPKDIQEQTSRAVAQEMQRREQGQKQEQQVQQKEVIQQQKQQQNKGLSL